MNVHAKEFILNKCLNCDKYKKTFNNYKKEITILEQKNKKLRERNLELEKMVDEATDTHFMNEMTIQRLVFNNTYPTIK